MTGLIVLPVLLGVAFAVAMRLARGLEDERERFGEDQYLRDGKRIDLSRYSVHFDPGSPDGARQVNFKSPDSNNK